MKQILVLVAVIVAAVATPTPQPRNKCPIPPTVEEFHFGEYSGRWYEIAKFPDPLEKDEKCISEEYHIYVNGTITVVHEAVDALTHERKQVFGQALVADVDDLSKLIFEMDNAPVGQHYWVVDTDYINYALVYSCTYENEVLTERARIFSRERMLSKELYQHVLEAMKTYNLNTKALKKTDQTDCPHQ